MENTFGSTAIVILNWNGKTYLEQFLPSVMRFSKGARVIVADNGSTDESVAFVQSHYPEIEIILNNENGGFAKGYNEALKQIDSEFYLLLNSDIEVTENWLVPLLHKMNDPNVAGCQPKIRSFHQRAAFEHAGASGGFLDRNYYPFCRGRLVDQVEIDEGQYNQEAEVFWATGAALLIRSELFHRVGGFDEAFFAHMEEIDLCWRIKKLGYSFYVIPESEIYHVGGGTLPYLSPKKSFLNFRNSLYMLVKNHSGWLFPKLFWRMKLDGIAAMRFLVRGEFVHIRSIWNAHMELYKRLPQLLRQRKSIKQLNSKENLTGLYKGSLLWARYFKGIGRFSELNQRLFIRK
jgi:GT2 family glycosyltransferase